MKASRTRPNTSPDAAEPEQREAVPGERRDQGGQQRGGDGDDQAVDDVADDVVLAGQQRLVVRERQVREGLGPTARS